MNLNATIIGQAIAFAFFVWFCLKFVWPPITSVLKQRQQKIADGIENAEKAEKNFQLAEVEMQKKVEEGKKKAQEIIAQAHQQADLVIDKAKTEAQAQANRITSQANDNLETMRNKVREELKDEMGTVMVQSLEQILGKSLSAEIDKKYIEQVAKQL